MQSSLIMKVSRADVSELVPLPNSSVRDPKHLASYNWLEAPTPTIVVPGIPPLWRSAKSPRQLKKDSGLVYTSQNAARHPDSPLEPLFRALYIEDPLFDISSIDIISDRNNIRKLLSFIDPSSNVYGAKSFTIQVEFVDRTAILHRVETVTTEFIGPNDFKGYGHEFEKAYTTNQIPKSTGHHRIVSYRLGDLRFIIRHETDGYLDADAPTGANQESAGDGISDLLQSLSISQPAGPLETTSPESKLTICRQGRHVALASTLEIKTRVQHKNLSIADVAPQLWISQTPQLVRAYHDGGRFRVPVVEDVTAEIKSWEETNQKALGKLAALLASILAKGRLCGNLAVKYDALRDILYIQQDPEKKMFPVDLYRKWRGDHQPKCGQRSQRDSHPVQANANDDSTSIKVVTAETDSNLLRAAPSADTRDNTYQKTAIRTAMPCYICERMRTARPHLHGKLVNTNEVRICLLCHRPFCDRHSGDDKAVCEINHSTYYTNHRDLYGVYPSIAARESALGEHVSTQTFAT